MLKKLAWASVFVGIGAFASSAAGQGVPAPQPSAAKVCVAQVDSPYGTRSREADLLADELSRQTLPSGRSISATALITKPSELAAREQSDGCEYMVHLRTNTPFSGVSKPMKNGGGAGDWPGERTESIHQALVRVDYEVFGAGAKKAMTHGAATYQRQTSDLGKDSLMAQGRAQSLAQEIASKLPK